MEQTTETSANTDPQVKVTLLQSPEIPNIGIPDEVWEAIEQGQAVQLPMPEQWKDPAQRPFLSPMDLVLLMYRATEWALPDIKKTTEHWLINQYAFVYRYLPEAPGVPPSQITKLKKHLDEALQFHNTTKEQIIGMMNDAVELAKKQLSQQKAE